MRPVIVGLVAASLLALSCGGSDERVIVAAGTTLVDSGILDELVVEFEASEPGVNVSVVARATAEVLELGARGAADVLITHAPAREAAFLAAHPEAVAAPLFSSRFLLVGPPEVAASLDGLSPQEAFTRIASSSMSFVTRADGSGTHERELALWAATGIEPSGPWYRETGQGMGLSLQVADQTGALILVEEGSYLAAADRLSLVPVALTGQGGSALDNPYTAIVVSGAAGARSLVAWLTSAEGRAALARANLTAFGTSVFAP